MIPLDRILIADDLEENRNAAAIIMPNAVIVSCAEDAISILEREPFDLVLTDMRMETPLAGLDVVKAAYRAKTGALPYVISHTGPSHGAEMVEVKPYVGSISIINGKANPETWRIALERIRGAESTHQHYQEAFLKRKQRINFPIPDVVITAMYATSDVDVAGGRR
jgi:CheY-like chemotaxis protein